MGGGCYPRLDLGPPHRVGQEEMERQLVEAKCSKIPSPVPNRVDSWTRGSARLGKYEALTLNSGLRAAYRLPESVTS